MGSVACGSSPQTAGPERERDASKRCNHVHERKERRKKNKQQRKCGTQLDSLLYPRDERSATWAFPPAATWHPLERVNHVHMYSLPHNNAAGTASNSLRHSCAAQPAKHTQFNICLPFGGRHSGFWQTHPFRAGSRFTTAGRRFLSRAMALGLFCFFFSAL